MREDGKRNFLGIVMGGCGRYVFFLLLFLGKGRGDGDGYGDGDGKDGLVQGWNGMYDF